MRKASCDYDDNIADKSIAQRMAEREQKEVDDLWYWQKKNYALNGSHTVSSWPLIPHIMYVCSGLPCLLPRRTLALVTEPDWRIFFPLGWARELRRLQCLWGICNKTTISVESPVRGCAVEIIRSLRCSSTSLSTCRESVGHVKSPQGFLLLLCSVRRRRCVWTLKITLNWEV